MQKYENDLLERITEIENSEYIQRGYSNLVTKLTNIGAKIKITE